MRNRNQRKFIMYGLMIALALTTVAYSAISTVLTISGTVTKKGGSWNIYFTNVSNPTLTGTASMNKPSLGTTTSLSFSVTLIKPLDKAEFTVDVVNDGSMNAILNAVDLRGIDTASASDVTYEITYADGNEIKKDDTLLSKETKTIKIVVSYDNVSSISSTDTKLDLGLTLTYIQLKELDEETGGGTEPTKYTDPILAGNDPNLLNNSLVPVVYDATANSGAGSWKVADTTQEWYNYSEQEWANAVILDDGITKNVGDTVLVPTASSTTTEVKAMYVWIPRYSYTIKSEDGTNYYGKTLSNVGGSTASLETPGAIDIKFISTNTVETGTAQYTGSTATNWRTHPAFQWDTDNSGSISSNENITGIWVGKFETSASTTDTCYSSKSETNCTSNLVTPKILPNVMSLQYQNVYNEFLTAQKFGTYLSDSTNIDSHMMKNSEWGAVAYLLQSIYGKYGNSNYTGTNKEVYKNDSSDHYTGRSSGVPPASGYSASGTCYYDNSSDRGSGTGSCGGGASTTGNIYGVYDMSGGSPEHVMAYYDWGASTWGANSSSNYAGFSSKPEIKYYDSYTGTTSSNFIKLNSLTACNGGICYGQGISETSGWYSDYTNFVTKNSPWLNRGASHGDIYPGVFTVYSSNGNASYSDKSFRSVLLEEG